MKKTNPTQRLISKHFQYVRNQLLHTSHTFATATHNGIKGTCREALAEHFLSSHLPRMIEYFTGEIIDPKDKRSSQIDLILYGNHCPKLPLLKNLNLAFVDATMAAIEVKSFLDAKQMKSCMIACHRLKRLYRHEFILGLNDTREKFDAIKKEIELIRKLDEKGIRLEFRHETRNTNLKSTPYIVFAYKGTSADSLIKQINEYSKTKKRFSYLEYGPDLILNLEEGFYIYKNNDWLWPQRVPATISPYCIWKASSEERKGDVLAGLHMYLSNLSTAFLLRPPIVELPQYYDLI